MSVDRLRISDAFPFWIERAKRWNKCLHVKSCDAFAGERASSRPRRDIWRSAIGCHPPKVSRRRKTRIKNLKDFLDNDYNQTSDEKKKKRRLLRKKLNCYRNLRIYKRKHKVGKKATNQQIFKNNILPYLCTINLQYKLLFSEVQNCKRLCRAIFNAQFKV